MNPNIFFYELKWEYYGGDPLGAGHDNVILPPNSGFIIGFTVSLQMGSPHVLTETPFLRFNHYWAPRLRR